VVLPEGADRDGVRNRLAEGGIQTSLHYPPIHTFTDFALEADVPVTEEYARRAVTLPLFPGITEEQVELVVGALAEAL
jgi:dTDP-4-amino-4,6-dideoxygalactose transaminase